MSNLFELITPEQKDMIETYIECYAVDNSAGYGSVTESRRAPLEKVLEPWCVNKSLGLLSYIFKDELIISEDVEFKTPLAELIYKLDGDRQIMNFEGEFRNWIYKLEDYCCDKHGMTRTDYYTLNHALWALSQHETLARNRYDGPTVSIPLEENRELVISNGCKPVKMLGKINKQFNISEHFEEYRVAVSMCLNVATVRGKLCLSIHPLDFMTMSDNDSNWESCMSWQNDGAYRQGTVEMMNSCTVLVAYLAASNDMYMPGNHYWSNKKWRSLYVVDSDIITSVKGYPYQIPEIDKIIVEKIKTLLAEGGYPGVYGDVKRYEYGEFPSEHGTIETDFTCDYMYNDFGTIDHTGCVREDEGHTSTYISMDYSGPSECMWCGDCYSEESEEGLACSDCYRESRCDCCGERHTPSTLYETGDGEWVCADCLQEYYTPSIRDERYYRSDGLTRVTVVPDEFKGAIESGALLPRKFDYDIPFIVDHVAGDFRTPEDTIAINEFNKFLKEGHELSNFSFEGWWGPRYIFYIYLSDLKPEYQKTLLESDYCYNMYGYSYYEAWRNCPFVWNPSNSDNSAVKWVALIENKD